MKTLIFNGSPREKGDTVSLISEFLKHLDGEYKIVTAYDCNVAACIDCRWCWKNPGCFIQDGMQEIYDYVQECDNVLIASPLHFAEITGKLLSVGSRLQTYYSASYFRKEKPVAKAKKGGIILVSGGIRKLDAPLQSSRMLLEHMNARDVFPYVYGSDTNHGHPADKPEVLQQVKELAEFFNG
ncbi:flavodoxin family protein [Parasporobacterium paucivorans]|uniref:NADPH-dependent FMN reductase n=1 Tax=Parasporobacterium paucivorans DSM 15970 TaxID=1122934 RepID=A0A1M6IF61_9FIRM|nr:flavodoxin family protein [Parasporobacterium paucivorans]SHJ33065.1 NADPH-dependent FMN reductase [Parasporobacterium paucivorans DSM 15970]